MPYVLSTGPHCSTNRPSLLETKLSRRTEWNFPSRGEKTGYVTCQRWPMRGHTCEPPCAFHSRAARDEGKVRDAMPNAVSGSEPDLPHTETQPTVRLHKVNRVPSRCILPNMFMNVHEANVHFSN